MLIDFGLSDYEDEKGELIFYKFFGFFFIVKIFVKRCGTLGYMAPELLNEKYYGTEIDIFSAGIILY